MFFRKDEEYVEMDHQEEKKEGKIPIHVEKIKEYADSDRIQKKLRDGSILLIDIKHLRETNINELKRAIDRVRRTCEAMGGEIAGVGEDWIIATPPSAKINRD